MAAYEYDEQGQSIFFGITFLVLLLLPSTYSVLRRDEAEQAMAAMKAPARAWNRKTVSAIRGIEGKSPIHLKHLLLAVGWSALAVMSYQAAGWKTSSTLYDPFAILGITEAASDREIKRHYRRLSLKFHPDKLQLAPNQSKADADAYFVDLTKAYKTLTDEVVRRNFELFGHPDGKQDFGAGIAIPKWVVDSSNNVLVLGLYASMLGVALPFLVARWWFRSRRRTKEGILNDTAALFFHEFKEDTKSFSQAVEILSCAIEFKESASIAGKEAAHEYERLEKEVKEQLKTRSERLEGKLYRRPYCKRVAVHLYAHLFRLPVMHPAMVREQQTAVLRAIQLATSLGNVALSHNWLSAYTLIIGLQQHLVQALHPTLSPLLQLPSITTNLAQELYKQRGISTIKEFVRLVGSDENALLPDLQPSQVAEAVEVGKHWPQLDIVSASFIVMGERIVTPGCFVQLELKVRQNPSQASDKLVAQQMMAQVAAQGPEGRGREMDFEELIGRRKVGSDGEEDNAYAHAPFLSSNRRPAWQVYVGDHKLDRVFVPPSRFSDIGPTKTRTIRIQFQAPPQPGLYTFQTHVRSECYVGTDAQIAMKLRVEPPEALGADAKLIEDEISDPEEDTIAGQMAAMRGRPYKPTDYEYDDEGDDSSDSVDEEDAASTTTSDSD